MINFVDYNFPFGVLRICYDNENITGISPVKNADRNSSATVLTDRVFSQICEYLDGKRKSFDFPYELRGTDFQKKVWKQLCEIPYGETRSYKDIATAIGNPRACRAVGMANNRNPIIIVVPCHRVVGSDGSLVGYAFGTDMKIKLLELEKQNKDNL